MNWTEMLIFVLIKYEEIWLKVILKNSKDINEFAKYFSHPLSLNEKKRELGKVDNPSKLRGLSQFKARDSKILSWETILIQKMLS